MGQCVWAWSSIFRHSFASKKRTKKKKIFDHSTANDRDDTTEWPRIRTLEGSQIFFTSSSASPLLLLLLLLLTTISHTQFHSYLMFTFHKWYRFVGCLFRSYLYFYVQPREKNMNKIDRKQRTPVISMQSKRNK